MFFFYSTTAAEKGRGASSRAAADGFADGTAWKGGVRWPRPRPPPTAPPTPGPARHRPRPRPRLARGCVARAGRRNLASMVALGVAVGLLLPLVLRAHMRAGEVAWLGPTPPVSGRGLRPPACSQAGPSPATPLKGREGGLQARPGLLVPLGYSSCPSASSIPSSA